MLWLERGLFETHSHNLESIVQAILVLIIIINLYIYIIYTRMYSSY